MKHTPLFFSKTSFTASLLALSLIGSGMYKESVASPADSVKKYQENKNSKLSKSKPVATMNKEKQIELSKQHLASRMEVDPQNITLSGIESVSWRSGSMGCPKPGMMYTQALVPGVLIRLTLDGETYRYHAAKNGQPFYCPNDRAETPSPNSGDM